MVTYSHKDVKLTINDAEMYCSELSIEYGANIEPSWNIESRHSAANVALGPPQGTFSLKYFLTGKDPLVDFLDERKSFSINVNGLHVNSGYLSAYSVEVNAYAQLVVTATLPFFEEIKGSFTPDFSLLPTDREILDVTNATIVGGSIIQEESLASFSYSYDVNIEPNYVLPSDGGTPALSDVQPQQQKQTLSASIYDLDYYLPETGILDDFVINFNNKNGDSQQSFNINGVIGTKKTSISADNRARILTQIDMGQAHFNHAAGAEPSITSISPTEGYVRSSVTLVGEKFINVEKVLLGEFPCQITNVFVPADPANAYTLSFDVSPDIFSGYKAPVYLITQGKKVSSPSVYSVTSGLTF